MKTQNNLTIIEKITSIGLRLAQLKGENKILKKTNKKLIKLLEEKESAIEKKEHFPNSSIPEFKSDDWVMKMQEMFPVKENSEHVDYSKKDNQIGCGYFAKENDCTIKDTKVNKAKQGCKE